MIRAIECAVFCLYSVCLDEQCFNGQMLNAPNMKWMRFFVRIL